VRELGNTAQFSFLLSLPKISPVGPVPGLPEQRPPNFNFTARDGVPNQFENQSNHFSRVYDVYAKHAKPRSLGAALSEEISKKQIVAELGKANLSSRQFNSGFLVPNPASIA